MLFIDAQRRRGIEFVSYLVTYLMIPLWGSVKGQEVGKKPIFFYIPYPYLLYLYLMGVERRKYHIDCSRKYILAIHMGLVGNANLLFALDSDATNHVMLMVFHKTHLG